MSRQRRNLSLCFWREPGVGYSNVVEGSRSLALSDATDAEHPDSPLERTATAPRAERTRTAARLALRSRAPVVPVFFEGANSVPFHVAGILHPDLRTIGLAREFHRMRGKTVRLHVGKPVPNNVLNGYRDPKHATAYMRSRSPFLANRSAPAPFHRTLSTTDTSAWRMCS